MLVSGRVILKSSWWPLMTWLNYCTILPRQTCSPCRCSPEDVSNPAGRMFNINPTNWYRCEKHQHDIDVGIEHNIYIYIWPNYNNSLTWMFRGFWGSSLTKPPFRVTSADVVIICPDTWYMWCPVQHTVVSFHPLNTKKRPIYVYKYHIYIYIFISTHFLQQSKSLIGEMGDGNGLCLYCRHWNK